jgi:hypothetical protein
MRSAIAAVLVGLALVASSLAASSLAAPALALDAAATEKANLQVLALNPGIGNKCRGGAFFPVAVELTALSEPVSGAIAVETDLTGENIPRYVVPFDLSPGARYRYFVYPYCDSAAEKFTVVITDSRGKEYRREELLMNFTDQQSYLAGVLGTQGIPGLVKREPTEQTIGLDVALVAGDFMPSKECGYDSLDVLVWAHPDPAALSPTQINAIRDWVLGGGRLVLALGDTWQPAASTFLAGLLPGTVTGVEGVTALDALAMRGAAPFKAGDSMVAAVLGNPAGEVLLSGAGMPLAVRKRAGFGEVIFVAFDPTRNPFATWEGAGRFWDWLLELNPTGTKAVSADSPAAPASRNVRMSMRGRGYYPGGGQGISQMLVTAVNQFTEVKPISFAFVVGFLAAYVILVGPVDYFVLKKLKHLEWTWFTFPAIAIAATVVAFVVISSGRVARAYINQVSIADWSADGKFHRGHTMSALISPRNDYYDISYKMPGCTLYQAEAAVDRYMMGGITFSSRFDLVDYPETGMTALKVFMPVWSPRTFWGRWQTDHPPEPPFTVALTSSAKGIAGSVTNATKQTIESAWFIHRDGVCKLGTIKAGGSADIGWSSRLAYKDFVKSAAGGRELEVHPSRSPAPFRSRAESLVLAATLGGDWRFYPYESRETLRRTLEGAGGGLVYDLPSEMSLRSLIESGQAVVTGVSGGSIFPIEAGRAAPTRSDWTFYRICVAVPGQ